MNIKTRIKATRAYLNMMERCYTETANAYKNYGGRNIIVCEEWILHPEIFIEWYGSFFLIKDK